MKTIVLPCLLALTGISSAESPPPRIIEVGQLRFLGEVADTEPNAPARRAVMTQIVARLQPPSLPPFSRAMPAMPYPSYRAVELAAGEERLPFTVKMVGTKDEVSGYVRLSDNAIFIFRPEKKDHIRSTLDPRFAPPQEIRIEPEKPA